MRSDASESGAAFWAVAGSGFLVAISSWSWLSRRFIYGEGHAQRPIIGFLAAYAVAWLIFAVALRRARSGPMPLGWIVFVAIASRLVLLPSNLILENDPYRYVLDGQMLLRGQNPYLLSPTDLRLQAKGPLAVELQRPDARLTLDRIGYPEVPTLYPPAAQLAFAAGGWLAGWDWRGQRWTFLALDLLVLGILLLFQPRFGADRAGVLLYAWNPLVLKEVANSAHLDVLVGFFLLLSFLALLDKADRPSGLRVIVSGGALGLAALSKLYPLVFVPAFCLNLHRRAGWRRSSLFLAAVVGCFVLGCVPFLANGWEPVTEGLRIYAREWTMNEGAFSLLALITSKARFVSALIVAFVALLIPWADGDASIGGLCRHLQWILLCWFLLIPAAFPWYALPLMALSALRPRTIPARVSVPLSGAVALYYLSFYYEYHLFADGWWLATRILEHGLIWCAIVWLVWKTRREAALSDLVDRRDG